jgi:DNA-binding transcriptional LysR family regulator
MDQIVAMRAFKLVVETGSFSAASDAMNVSHTAVSRQIKQLEEVLGTQLLNRTTRRLALTQAGQLYYQHTVEILEQLEDAALAISQHQTHASGTLRINAPMAFGTLELSRWLPHFMASYPDIRVDLVCDDRFVDLIEGGFDIGLRVTRALPDSTLIAKRLATCEMALVASPAYVQRFGAPEIPGDLVRHNYLAYSLALRSTDLLLYDSENQSHIVTVRGNLQANTGIIVTEAVLAGQGITASATFVIHESLRRGDLVRLLPEYRLEPRELYALYPKNRHVSAKVRAFIDFAAEYYAVPRWVC